jgi:hypothetical protein
LEITGNIPVLVIIVAGKFGQAVFVGRLAFLWPIVRLGVRFTKIAF